MGVPAQIAGTLLRMLAAPLLNLAAIALIARTLGPDGNGVYALAVMLPTLAMTLLNLGLPTANVYHLGRGTLSLRGLVKSTGWLWLALSTAGSLGFVAWGLAPSVRLLPGLDLEFILVGAVMFPLLLLQAGAASMVNGVGDFGALNRGLLLGPLIMALTLGALVFEDALSLRSALLATVLGQVVALGALVWPLIRLRRQTAQAADAPPAFLRDALRFGFRSHVANVLQMLNYRVDIFFVNSLVGVGGVGLYSIAVQLSERMWSLSQAVSTVLLPKLAGQYAADNESSATAQAARLTFALTSAACVLLALVGSVLIDLLFGSLFSDSYAALLWLLPGTAFGALLRVIANDFLARGLPERNMAVSARMLVLNLALNALLIPRLGITGAAIATTACYSYGAVSHLRSYCALTALRPGTLLFDPKADVALIRELLRRLR